MHTLDDFDRELFEKAYADERWIYATRAEEGCFALGLVVVGRRDMVKVPLCSCHSASFEEMRSYADFLNEERMARLGITPEAEQSHPDEDVEAFDELARTA